MKNKLRNKISILIIFVVAFLVLYFSLKDNYSLIIRGIINIKIKYLLFALSLLFMYYYLRSITFYSLITKFNKNYKFSNAFSLFLKSEFFNGLTPFATGGQPFQVYMLKKDGVKVSDGTNIIVQNFVMYQIALISLATISIILNHYLNVFSVNGATRWLVIFGFSINMIVTIFLLLVVFAFKLNVYVGKYIIVLLFKLRIVKNKDILVNKWQQFVLNFHEGTHLLLSNKKTFIKNVFYNFIALCALYLIPLALFLGSGDYDISAYKSIITSSYVMLIGSFVPIPGGSGGLEYSFVLFYSYYIKKSVVKSCMLVWRFITYYLGIFIGFILLNVKKGDY